MTTTFLSSFKTFCSIIMQIVTQSIWKCRNLGI